MQKSRVSGRRSRGGVAWGTSGVGVALGLALVAQNALAAGLDSATTSPLPSAADTHPQKRDVVSVFVIGSETTFESVRGVVGAQSLRPITLRWERKERFDPSELISSIVAGDEIVIRCWLDVTDATRVHLYFADHDARRFLIRELQLSGRLDELDRESLGQALELSIHALVDDQHAGLTREQARSLLAPRSESKPETPPPADVPRPPTPRPHSGLAANAFWAGEAHSAAIPLVHGPGLGVSYRSEGARYGGAAWLSGQYELKQSYRQELVGVELDGAALRSGGDVLLRSSTSPFFGGLRAGIGLDVTHFSPSPGLSASGVALTPARTKTSLLTTSGVFGGLDLGARLRVTLGVFVDVELSPIHYDLEVNGQNLRIVDPYRIRPGALLALGIR